MQVLISKDCKHIKYIEEHVCSCFIEFIKRVDKKRSNARLAEHLVAFLQLV